MGFQWHSNEIMREGSVKRAFERLFGSLAGAVTCSFLVTLLSLMMGVQDWRLAAWLGLLFGSIIGVLFPRVFIELFFAIFGLIF